ncbi:response regulator transcription factor [Roseateles saccharophilus]|uniref:LuxR family two component transcriptional regulator n=2 Tax=Roseateles saccharophilus TaxID=304 RepID=A0A4R3U8I1_ROSSA|nr:LuxR family two component transcriptional regulator [Roseateles saccharophilus]
MFREGLALLLAHQFPQWQLLQAGSLGQAAALLAESPGIALVVLDLSLPDSEGLATLTRLRAQAPAPRYVVLSASDAAEFVVGAIEAGAAGFVPKTSQTGAMLAAMRAVLDGGVVLPTAFGGDAAAPARTPVEALGISPRQSDVLRLLIEGKSNKAISRDLGIAESTVKTHLEVIYRKLDATSRTQAVVAAARLGLRLDARPESAC